MFVGETLATGVLLTSVVICAVVMHSKRIYRTVVAVAGFVICKETNDPAAPNKTTNCAHVMFVVELYFGG